MMTWKEYGEYVKERMKQQSQTIADRAYRIENTRIADEIGTSNEQIISLIEDFGFAVFCC